jgi:hypothetical protein
MVSGALIMYMYKILQCLRTVILHPNNLLLLTTATTNGVCANFSHQVDCNRIYEENRENGYLFHQLCFFISNINSRSCMLIGTGTSPTPNGRTYRLKHCC